MTIEELRQLIADTARRCVELERAVAAMVSLSSDERAADEALRSTQHLLWLYRQRLARVERGEASDPVG